MNRLHAPMDGLLHLMDRQVVDDEGRLVCKCDDLELTQRDDGSLRVTALLVGAPVLVPRLGAWLHRRWERLADAQADRNRPYRIGLADIDAVTHDIELNRPGNGVLTRQRAGDPTVRRLVGDLLGTEVRGEDGQVLGDVLDVRLGALDPAGPSLKLTALLVGRGRPGSYLGYDRTDTQGPWLVNQVVRQLHRHSGLLPVRDIDSIDWDEPAVHARGPLQPLTRAFD